jgi:predicted nucleotidyltransferase
LRKRNPALIEWVRSPYVYRAEPHFADELRALADAEFGALAGVHHYATIARSNELAVLHTEPVVLKKYLYMLRAVLAVEWILVRSSPPPMLLGELVRDLVRSDAPMTGEIAALVARKRSGLELGRGPRLPRLHEFLVERMATLDSAIGQAANMATHGIGDAELNAFLRRWIRADGTDP